MQTQQKEQQTHDLMKQHNLIAIPIKQSIKIIYHAPSPSRPPPPPPPPPTDSPSLSDDHIYKILTSTVLSVLPASRNWSLTEMLTFTCSRVGRLLRISSLASSSWLSIPVEGSHTVVSNGATFNWRQARQLSNGSKIRIHKGGSGI